MTHKSGSVRGPGAKVPGPTRLAAAGGAPNTPQGLSARNGYAAFPDPEVSLKPERRRFTKAYKLDILSQVDACSGVGQIGALLRREGLYSSYLGSWRLQRSQGLLDNSATKKRAAPHATRKRHGISWRWSNWRPSSGGNVQVTGIGGGSGAAFNQGIDIGTTGRVSAGGMGNVTVLGIGGATTGSFNYGVWLDGDS